MRQMNQPAIQNRRPRVAMLGYSPEHPGGVTRVTQSWLEAGLGARVELEEIHTSRWDDPPPRQLAQALAAALALARILGRGRADVVHLQLSTGGSLFRKLVAALMCRACRVPYVVHVHSGDFEGWVTRSAVARRCARLLIADAAVTIALAERWRPFLERLGARRIVVIPNGLTAAELRSLEAVRKMPSPPTGAAAVPVLLYYGRWTPAKGIDRVAAALRELGGADYEVRLFGSGDREWLEAAFEGLDGEVRIGGWIDIDRKVAELAAATVLLVPSRVEGFGQILLDARAAGVPVIASDCGAVGEVLDGHAPALLIDCGDEDGLRAALGRVLDGSWPPPAVESPPLPERYRADAAVEALVELYTELSVPAHRR